jgi:hypothetical protein
MLHVNDGMGKSQKILGRACERLSTKLLSCIYKDDVLDIIK